MYYPLTQVELPTPARADHTFVGWYTNPAFIGQPVTSVMMDRDRSVYAKWEEIVYYETLRLTIALYNNADEIQKVVDNQPYYFVRVDDRGREIETLADKLDGFNTSQRSYSFWDLRLPRGKYILKGNSGKPLGQIDTITNTQKKLETAADNMTGKSYYNVILYDPAPVNSVLYQNGTLVINELIEDRETNKSNYGYVSYIWKALTAENNYEPEWYPGWTYDPNARANGIKRAKFGSPIKPTTMEHWFDNCRNLVEVDTTGLDTSDCENMRCVFQDCNKITTCDMSTWDTSKVKTMSGMFNNCWAWLDLNVDNFDTSKVENFSAMFGTTKMESFAPKLNTSSATWMSSMFGYTKLKELDLSTFDTRNVEEFAHMFTSNFDLERIIVGPNFVVNPGAGSTSMFLQCYNITGGNGTGYDATKVDGSMAHIDTADNPGYFTGA